MIPLTWGGQECVRLAAYDALTHDLARIIDRLGEQELPRRVLRDELIEVDHSAVLPEERVRRPVRIEPEANHLAAVVDGVAAGATVATAPGNVPRSSIPVVLVHTKA